MERLDARNLCEYMGDKHVVELKQCAGKWIALLMGETE